MGNMPPKEVIESFKDLSQEEDNIRKVESIRSDNISSIGKVPDWLADTTELEVKQESITTLSNTPENIPIRTPDILEEGVNDKDPITALGEDPKLVTLADTKHTETIEADKEENEFIEKIMEEKIKTAHGSK